MVMEDCVVYRIRSKIVRLGLPVLFGALVCNLSADDKNFDARIRQWIADLGDKKFAVRQTTHQHLAELGKPAFYQLKQIAQSGTPEQRFRAREIIRSLNWRTLHRGFLALSQQQDDQMDLEEAMWLISLIVDPQVEQKPLKRQLDEMAIRVRVQLGEGVDPATAEPQLVVNSLVSVLKDTYKLAGAHSNYDHPDNSSPDRVLSSKKGLPILLSHIAVSVADRPKVPIVGIPVPGRYMIKYEGSQAPKGFPTDDIIINPFDNWQTLTQGGVRELIPRFDPEVHLVPGSRREIIDRMLQNLISDFVVVQQPDQVAQTMKCIQLFESGAGGGSTP